MPLTLREALTMVEQLRKSRVVAGEQGLDNAVESVNVLGPPRRTPRDHDVSAAR